MIDLWTEAVYRTTNLQFSVKGIPQSLEELKTALWVKVDGEPTQDESKFDFTFAQIEAKKQELETLVPLEQLRRLRDKKLSATDWWASSASLDDVVWPEEPV